jgi:hypothetical protein
VRHGTYTLDVVGEKMDELLKSKEIIKRGDKYGDKQYRKAIYQRQKHSYHRFSISAPTFPSRSF